MVFNNINYFLRLGIFFEKMGKENGKYINRLFNILNFNLYL